MTLRERLARGEPVTFERRADPGAIAVGAVCWIAAVVGLIALFARVDHDALVSPLTPREVVYATAFVVWFGSVALLIHGPVVWSIRRHGRCTITGDELAFGLDGVPWVVDRRDVLGWRITRWGVEVRAAARTLDGKERVPTSRWERWLSPFLVPTKDDEEAAAVADHLAARPGER